MTFEYKEGNSKDMFKNAENLFVIPVVGVLAEMNCLLKSYLGTHKVMINAIIC